RSRRRDRRAALDRPLARRRSLALVEARHDHEVAAAGAEVLARRVLLAFALVALSGCGGQARDPVAAAVKRTLAAPGARVSVTSTIRVPGSARPIALSGTGSIDNRARRSRVVFSGTLHGEEIVDVARSVAYARFPSL